MKLTQTYIIDPDGNFYRLKTNVESLELFAKVEGFYGLYPYQIIEKITEINFPVFIWACIILAYQNEKKEIPRWQYISDWFWKNVRESKKLREQFLKELSEKYKAPDEDLLKSTIR